MTIRKGKAEDIPGVVKIYEHIMDNEESGKNVTGWIRGVYPTEKTAMEMLNSGELFVMEEDSVIAAAARINNVQVPEYAKADWEDKNAAEDEVMVMHTLVVEPGLAGKGCGTEFIRFYENYAAEQGCRYLRIDTNARNKAARRLYKYLGYREAGIVPCVFNGIEGVDLVCLEKRVNK